MAGPIVDMSFFIRYAWASLSPTFPPVIPFVPVNPIAASTVLIKGKPAVDLASVMNPQPCFCVSPIYLPQYIASSAAMLGAPVPCVPCPFMKAPFICDPTITTKGSPILDSSAIYTCSMAGGAPCVSFIGVSTITNI